MYAKLDEALYTKGYTHSLFHKKTLDSTNFVAIYVILTGTSVAEIEELKTFLHKKFKIKDLGKLYYFFRMKLLYKEDGTLFQKEIFFLIS